MPLLRKRSMLFRGKWYVQPTDTSLSNHICIYPKDFHQLSMQKAMQMPSNTLKWFFTFINFHLPLDVLSLTNREMASERGTGEILRESSEILVFRFFIWGYFGGGKAPWNLVENWEVSVLLSQGGLKCRIFLLQ